MNNRRNQRFVLELPVSFTFPGPDRSAHSGVTRNISSTGVLFLADKVPDLGGAIEYVITLKNTCDDPLQLRCIGKVVRCEKARFDRGFTVAATLERYEFVRAASL